VDNKNRSVDRNVVDIEIMFKVAVASMWLANLQTNTTWLPFFTCWHASRLSTQHIGGTADSGEPSSLDFVYSEGVSRGRGFEAMSSRYPPEAVVWNHYAGARPCQAPCRQYLVSTYDSESKWTVARCLVNAKYYYVDSRDFERNFKFNDGSGQILKSVSLS
jgi:hypothetical protein